MIKNKITSLLLSLLAAALCFGNFIYKYIVFDKTDYLILAAGVFVLAIGISSYKMKIKKESDTKKQ